MKQCSNCDNMIADAAKFCPYCGTKQETEEEYIFCPNCGSKIGKDLIFCTNCGKKVGYTDPAAGVWENPDRQETDDAWETQNPPMEAEVPFILKIAGIIFGIIYVIFALTYFAYLGYGYVSFKLVGLLQIAAYGWSALILFLLAMKGRRENGIYLLYGLLLGSAVACVMHIVNLALSSSHYGYGNGGLGRFIFTMIVAAAIVYIMYNEHLLMPREDCGSTADILRTMPGIVRETLPRTLPKKEGGVGPERIRRDYEEVNRTEYEYDYAEGNSVQERLLSMGGNVCFLIFCIAFSAELLCQMFTNFSLLNMVGYALSLVLCGGMWCVYVGCRNGRLIGTGFTIISVIVTIDLVIQSVFALILVYIAIELMKDDDLAAAGIAVLVCAVLLILYWVSLRKTAHRASLVARGKSGKLHASLYPVVLLCISAVWKTLMLALSSYIQYYLSDLMSAIGGLSDMYGEWTDALGELSSYGYGYENGYTQTLSLWEKLGESVVNWVESLLGFQDNAVAMVLGIVVPVCCIVLLMKVRHARRAV